MPWEDTLKPGDIAKVPASITTTGEDHYVLVLSYPYLSADADLITGNRPTVVDTEQLTWRQGQRGNMRVCDLILMVEAE